MRDEGFADSLRLSLSLGEPCRVRFRPRSLRAGEGVSREPPDTERERDLSSCDCEREKERSAEFPLSSPGEEALDSDRDLDLDPVLALDLERDLAILSVLQLE